MATGPRPRPFGTAPACRLVKAAELQGVPQAEAVLRTLRFALVHDRPRDGQRRGAARGRRERRRARRRARARRRRARPRSRRPTSATAPRRATPTRFAVTLGRTAATDGPDRYTAPSIVLRAGGRELVAPGFQPFEAVDVLVMNLVPDAERLPVPALAGPARRLPRRPHDRRGRARARRYDDGSRPGRRRGRAHPPVRRRRRRAPPARPRRALDTLRLSAPSKPASRN